MDWWVCSSRHSQPTDVAGTTPACLLEGLAGGCSSTSHFWPALIGSASALHVPYCIYHSLKFTVSSHSYRMADSLRSHSKAFSCFIFFLPIQSIHMSISKMGNWEVECCGYPAVNQYWHHRKPFILLHQQGRKAHVLGSNSCQCHQDISDWVFCWIFFLKELLAKLSLTWLFLSPPRASTCHFKWHSSKPKQDAPCCLWQEEGMVQHPGETFRKARQHCRSQTGQN